MRVNMIRIPCRDLQASQAFYGEGLGLKRLYGSVAEEHFAFNLVNTTLYLQPESQPAFQAGRDLGLSLQVMDIQRFFKEKSQLGFRFLMRPTRQPWGGMTATLLDPSANQLTIVET